MATLEMRSVQRWGGLAGLTGSVLFIGVFVFVGAVVGAEPDGLAGPVSRFPKIMSLRTVENGVYLAIVMLWVTSTLALFQRLRESRPAAALFGTVLNVVGLTVLAAGALPHAATVGLSDRYHAAGTSSVAKENLALQWHATLGMFDALLITGLVVMAASTVLLSSAMFAFGRAVGIASVILGAISLAAALAVLIDPRSIGAALCFFALIGFHFVVGWKLFRGAKDHAVR